MALPWTTMSSGVVMINGSGTSELVPLFAEEIRRKLKWRENNIAKFLWLKDVGEATALFAEMFSKKISPLFLITLGVLIRTLCLFLLHISILGLGGIGSPLWSIYMLSFLCVVAETAAKTAIENVLVLEFFSTRELVSLLLRASSNLSGSLLTSIHQAANPTADGGSSLILIQTIVSLLTSLPVCVNMIARHFRKAVELTPKNPTSTLIKYALMSSALVSVIFVGSFVREHSVQISIAAVACVIAIAPLYIGYKIEQDEQLKSVEAEPEEPVVNPGYNDNFWRSLISVEFGLILLGSCIALSSTTSAMDFVAQWFRCLSSSYRIPTGPCGNSLL
ncbi:hypothetical protein SO802_024060 [Lithocarpus litseifolius]|uniref:Nodulin-like domain-containing protein n=1 Tax=Lithocarpus litseifolius TaxID=425828 RepID=A0AAW2C9X7_9ROSI